MSTITDRILSMTADVVLEALIAAAGLASAGGMFQQKEPTNLCDVANRHKKEI